MRTLSQIYLKTYWKVALLGWQDSLVYRFNVLVWVLYAVVPALTLMLVWIAAYEGQPAARIGGLNLGEMLTYYLLVTALSVSITPNAEWDIASSIRDGKLTSFLLRPVSYFGYRMAWETSYQVVKTAMMLPAFGLIWWFFRAYISIPPLDWVRLGLFLLSCAGAYVVLTQLKFLLGISAFWLLEPGGLMEIWNVLSGLFAGRLLPLQLLPAWAQAAGNALPFSILYAFPLQILLGKASGDEIIWGFARQIVWIGVLTWAVKLAWRRGLLAYEAVGT